jgi:hypothetical protein
MSTSAPASSVHAEYTAVIKQDGAWWIGWIEEVPGVNCQERTRDELLGSLRLALHEALQMNRQDARAAAGENLDRQRCHPGLYARDPAIRLLRRVWRRGSRGRAPG